ncbi:MAG: plasmid mobilization relaxosome protein MobC [Oligoflexales bacterium]
MKLSKERRANIRFDEQEYFQICNDATIYGDTVPGMLKAVYFKRLPPAPKFSKDDALHIVMAINRVGNNINQIARHINSGGSPNAVNSGLSDVRHQLSLLKYFVVGVDGHC